jgi:PepB aminopeptidase
MSAQFKVELSQLAAGAPWSEGALISFSGEGAIVHLQQDETLKHVQKAGRLLANQGLKQITLVGDTWCT